MDNENINTTNISELGEFGLIDFLTENIEIKNKSTIKGVGDDCAVIQNTEKLTLVTTDLLVEGVHFDLVYMPLKHLGYKAAIVNFSDITAMNDLPKKQLMKYIPELSLLVIITMLIWLVEILHQVQEDYLFR